MGRRTVLLVASILVAAVGTALVFLYVSSINDRAIADQEPTRVLVAKHLIELGTRGSDAAAAGAFELKTLPRNAIAAGAVADVKPIADLMAKGPIFPGEQILLDKFGAAGTTEALPLPDGTIAVSVQLSDPARVAGFVAPGSHVAVFATVDRPSTATPAPRATATQPATTGASDAKLTAVLLPKAEVVAVGATTVVPVKTTDSSGTEQTEPIPKTILTLALTPGDAQRLVFASQQGELYFGLTTDKSGVTTAPGTTLDNLFR